MKQELIRQIELYLSGGQNLKKLRKWLMDDKQRILLGSKDWTVLTIFGQVETDLADLLFKKSIQEPQLRKTWRRMLNKILYGRKPC